MKRDLVVVQRCKSKHVRELSPSEDFDIGSRLPVVLNPSALRSGPAHSYSFPARN